jgi:hypothetical protein
MLKKLLIVVFLVLVTGSLFANGDFIDPFAVYVFSEGFSGFYDSVAGAFGFIDKKGNVVIQPEYSMIGKFNGGLALVQTMDYQFAFINNKGKIVIGPSDTMYTDFSDGLAYTWVGEEAQYIDKTGKAVLKVKFGDVRGFHDGLACVLVLDKDGNGKWGYIDKKGKLVIKAQYVEAGDFSDTGDGLATFGVEDQKAMYGFSYGYIDKKGAVVIKPRFLTASAFHEGLAFGFDADNEGMYGFFDKTGKWVIKPQFTTSVGDFSGGFAVAGIMDENDEMVKMGYIDKKGKFVIQPAFSAANRFGENLAAVIKDEKVGFIDKTGKFVIQPAFDAMFAGYEEY